MFILSIFMSTTHYEEMRRFEEGNGVCCCQVTQVAQSRITGRPGWYRTAVPSSFAEYDFAEYITKQANVIKQPDTKQPNTLKLNNATILNCIMRY